MTLSTRPGTVYDRARRHRKAAAEGREVNDCRCPNCGTSIAPQDVWCSERCKNGTLAAWDQFVVDVRAGRRRLINPPREAPA